MHHGLWMSPYTGSELKIGAHYLCWIYFILKNFMVLFGALCLSQFVIQDLKFKYFD